MEPINFDGARIEGGIEAFADVMKVDRTKPELGKIAVGRPTVELPPGIFDEDIVPTHPPVEYGTKPVPSPEVVEEYYEVLGTHPQVVHPTPRSFRFPINII